MINQELQNYVNLSRASGLSDAQIKQSLLPQGWTEDDINSVLNPNYSVHKSFWSTKKIILYIVLGISIIIVGGFFALFLGLFTGPSKIVADIQGGREENRWESDYVNISELMNYPDLCNKIYPLAYERVGGGFTGEIPGVIYSRDICFTRVAINTQDTALCQDIKGSSKFTSKDCEADVQANDIKEMPSDGSTYIYLNSGDNLLQLMGYTDTDFIKNFDQVGYESSNKIIINGDDFKSRLKNLPDFSNVKNDTKLLASALQCPQYYTSYMEGMPGYVPNLVTDNNHNPCCLDLNGDKICDQIQSKNSGSQGTTSVNKINISMTFGGPGFTPHPHDNPAYSDQPYAGYLIKDKPFNATVVVKNNNAAATNPSDVYFSFSVNNPDGGSVGLGDLSKYATVPIPVLQPGESKSFDFNNLIYTLDLSDNTLNTVARVQVQSDPENDYVFNSASYYLFAFSSEKDGQDYLKRMNW